MITERLIRRQKKRLYPVAAVFLLGCFGAVAANRTWTGSADGRSWSVPGNWNPQEVPTSADAAIFSGDADVDIDSDGCVDVGYVKVTSGDVKFTGTGDGTHLRLHTAPASGANGFVIQTGASLDLCVPVLTDGVVFSRWGDGSLIFHSAVTNLNGGYIAYGSNVFARGSSLYAPKGISFGNGPGTAGVRNCAVFRDDARLEAARISFTGSARCTRFELELDGDDAVIDCSGNINLNSASTVDSMGLILKRGNLRVGGTLYASASGGSDYVQYGGSAEVADLGGLKGAFAVRGGTFRTSGDMSSGDGTSLSFSDCTLAVTTNFEPSPDMDFSGTMTIDVASGKTWTWNASAPRSDGVVKYVKEGAGTLQFARSAVMDVPLEIREGQAALGKNVTLTAPAGSTNAWELSIGDGASMRLADMSSRLSLPLDLSFSGSGKFVLPSRSMIIARRIRIDGEECGRGLVGSNMEDSAGAATMASAILWTGAGDGTSWSDAGNWEGGVVPASGNALVVDMSFATNVVLDSDVSLRCLCFVPSGRRRLKLSGEGALICSTATGYACALYVKEDCELELDVHLRRDDSNKPQAIMGGGTVIARKSYPGNVSSGNPSFAVDGTVRFCGANAIENSPTYSDVNIFSGWSHEYGGRGRFVIADGAELSAQRLMFSLSGYSTFDSVVQTGGKTDFNEFYMIRHNGNGDYALCYELHGGEMTVTNAISLGTTYSSSSNAKRVPGGSFLMTGGTLVCGKFNCEGNGNYVRLYGGDVYFTNTFTVGSGGEYAVTNRNDDVFHLGGVTLRTIGPRRGILAPCVIDGIGGHTVIAPVAGSEAFYFFKEVSGPGGIVHDGEDTLAFEAGVKNTGPIISRCPKWIYFQAGSDLNGPRALVVEDPGGYIEIRGTVTKSPDLVSIPATKNFRLAAGIAMTVKKLVIGGVVQSPGTYSFPAGSQGTGTVTVPPAPDGWISDGVADLSYTDSGSTVTLDSPTNLTKLCYAPYLEEAAVSVGGTGALTLADETEIFVDTNCTLTISAPLVLAGKVRKTGLGKLVVNGSVTSAVTPGSGDDVYWLTVEEGSADIDCAVTGVRLVTCSLPYGVTPVLTLKSGCTVSDHAAVLTAFSADSSVADVTGVTVQQGATVDLSDMYDSFSSCCPLSRPNGGSGRYVLESGTLKMHPSWRTAFFPTGSDDGTFTFVQNGGRFEAGSAFYFAQKAYGADVTYELNGGTLVLSSGLYGADARKSRLNLNGGVLSFARSVASLMDEGEVSVVLDGTVSVEEKTEDVRAGFGVSFGGSGSVVHKGPGTLAIDAAMPLASVSAEAGTLELYAPACPLPETCVLSVSTGSTLSIPDQGVVRVDSAMIDGAVTRPGVYAAGDRRLGQFISGAGRIEALTGVVYGMRLILK